VAVIQYLALKGEGADLDMTDNEGRLPVHAAAMAGHLQALQVRCNGSWQEALCGTRSLLLHAGTAPAGVLPDCSYRQRPVHNAAGQGRQCAVRVSSTHLHPKTLPGTRDLNAQFGSLPISPTL
jgi:hypothetical protein